MRANECSERPNGRFKTRFFVTRNAPLGADKRAPYHRAAPPPIRTGVFRDRHFFLKPKFPYWIDDEDRVRFDRIPHDQIQFQNYIQPFEKKFTPQTPYFVCEYVKVGAAFQLRPKTRFCL